MRFTAVVAVLASAGFVAAQSTATAQPTSSPSGGKCDAQNIVDACKTTIQGQIDACKENDWICLCDQYTNLLTCYNNCPNSEEKPPVQNQVTQYCNAAAPLKASSSAAAASAGSTAAAQATTLATASQTGSPTQATGFGVSASASSTGAAQAIAAPVGGAFAVLLGVAGLL